MAENTRGAALRRAIETCIRPDDEAIATLGDLFTDDVTRVVAQHAGHRSRRTWPRTSPSGRPRSPTSTSRSIPWTSSGTGAWPSSASRPPSPVRS